MPQDTKVYTFRNIRHDEASIDASMRKVMSNRRKKNVNSREGYDSNRSAFDIGPDVKTLKLSMVLLVFLYSTDDDKISILEKRSFKKEIHLIDEFSEIDKRELSGLMDVLPDASYVFRYIEENNLSKAIVELAIKYLKEDVGLNKEDRKLLNNLTSQLKVLDQ